MSTCPNCGGKGKVLYAGIGTQQVCNVCNGTGQIAEQSSQKTESGGLGCLIPGLLFSALLIYTGGSAMVDGHHAGGLAMLALGNAVGYMAFKSWK